MNRTRRCHSQNKIHLVQLINNVIDTYKINAEPYKPPPPPPPWKSLLLSKDANYYPYHRSTSRVASDGRAAGL